MDRSEPICKMKLQITALGERAKQKVREKIDDLIETLKNYPVLCDVDLSSEIHGTFFDMEKFFRTKSPDSLKTISYSIDVYFCFKVLYFLPIYKR